MAKEVEQIIIVYWVDSFGGGYWFNKEAYESQVRKCISVGIVIAETDEYVTLTGSITDPSKEGGQYYAPQSIPKSSITYRQDITPDRVTEEENAKEED